MKLSEFLGNEEKKTGLVTALVEFKKTQPYRGTNSERVEKWQTLVITLSSLLGAPIDFFFVPNYDDDPEGDLTEGTVRAVEACTNKNKIVLSGKFSIITTLGIFFGFLEPDNELAKFDPNASYDSDEAAQSAYTIAMESMKAWRDKTVDTAYEYFREVWPKLAANLVKYNGMYVKKPESNGAIMVPGPSSVQ